MATAVLCGSCLDPIPIDGARCDAEHACGEGYACAAGQCRRLTGAIAPECTDDAPCSPLGLHCDLGSGRCVKCTEKAHCPGGNCKLDLNFCVDCLVPEDCDTRFCDLERGNVCRACKVDAHCGPEGRCEDGACVANPRRARDP